MKLPDIRRIFRYFSNKKRKSYLKNTNLSVFCNNCLAGCVLHDFGIKFNSPTVNLFLEFPDYIEFLKNIKHYVSVPIIDITKNSEYPIGWLANSTGGGIKIHFLHYRSFEEAKQSWTRRGLRINWDNLFFILVERDGCKYDDLQKFDTLPYINKVSIVHKKYKGINSQFVIKGFEKDNQVGNVMNFTGFFGKRIYDQYNWINFFNKNTR